MLRISSAKLLVITLFIVNGSCNSAEEIEDEFKPTKEWQVVRKGQRIPKGLHVRINFETGVTEAKLLDDDEEDDRNKQLLEIPQNSQHNTADDVFESLDDIKRAVKNIKDDFTPGDQKRRNFRSYEDIKRDFESLDLIPKTDAELIGELIKKFVETLKNDGKESLIPILEDLEYLSHQFDNANEFVRMDGFDRVIYKSLNATNNEVKSETLRLLGSLLQNNAKVQIHALETGSIDRLLKILALESDIVVKNRAVYALSCLLRRFPLAQKSFLGNAGLEVFSRVFEMSDLKIKLKIINCLYDLLIEHREAFENTESIDYANRTKQYRQVDLKNKLLQQNWCVKLSSLILNVYEIDPGDHDSIEKSLTIMNFFLKDCHQSYVDVKNVFKSLEAQYETLAVNDGDGYFENLHKMCVRIVGFLNKHRSEL